MLFWITRRSYTDRNLCITSRVGTADAKTEGGIRRPLRLSLKMQRFSSVSRRVSEKSNKDVDALSHAPIAAAGITDELG